ncbi:MAG: OsmC family protein [bacterium]
MTTPPASTLREYDISARSTDIFGRVLCSARNHHFIVDGPVQNDCPGEEVTPAEVFLSAVAACGVELIHVIARDQNAPLQRVAVKIHGEVDRAIQRRDDVTTFNSVRLDFTLWGVDKTQGAAVVDGFKRRCPLYGTVASATPDVQVNFTLGT